MSEYRIPYGKKTLSFEIPDDWVADVIKPKTLSALGNPQKEIMQSLESSDYWFSTPTTGKVAIAINDQTRPVPHDLLLPPLLKWLTDRGIKKNGIEFIVATGTHKPVSRKIIESIVPEEIHKNYRITTHDALDQSNLVKLETTRLGTPCFANRRFLAADLRIVVGNIEPHQFMGWSGGAKSASIGLAGYDTIQANHRHLIEDGCGPGRYEDNPMRQDVEDLGQIIGVDFALNVVMNDAKDIVAVVAGKPIDVMRSGIKTAQELFIASYDFQADLVITSPGGHPKDINFYQAQKALRHSAPAARPNAPIVLAAECPDGVGHDHYEEWVGKKRSHAEVIRAFESEDFKLGPHKARLVAVDALDRPTYLISRLGRPTVEKLLLEPAKDLQTVVDLWIDQFNQRQKKSRVRVAIIPFGNSTTIVGSNGPRRTLG